MAVRQLEEGRYEVENRYSRAVSREGNREARRMISRVFEPCDRAWRGIGVIPGSGYRLREEFAAYRRGAHLRLGGHRLARAGELHQRPDPAGRAPAPRLSGIRHRLHARDAPGRDHGFGRGRLRGLLQLREAPGADERFYALPVRCR